MSKKSEDIDTWIAKYRNEHKTFLEEMERDEVKYATSQFRLMVGVSIFYVVLLLVIFTNDNVDTGIIILDLLMLIAWSCLAYFWYKKRNKLIARIEKRKQEESVE